MEQTEYSETSAYQIQTTGNYPEESIQHSEHGESLKSSSLGAISRHFTRTCNIGLQSRSFRFNPLKPNVHIYYYRFTFYPTRSPQYPIFKTNYVVLYRKLTTLYCGDGTIYVSALWVNSRGLLCYKSGDTCRYHFSFEVKWIYCMSVSSGR
jgi:hypothetical protein